MMADRRRVSVGICAYNEATTLPRLLERLSAEPVDEILVAASGCTDGTEEIVRSAMTKDPRIRLLADPVRRGKAHAFNEILASYRGDVLVSLPADVLPRPGLVRALLDPMAREVGIVAGLPIPVNPDGRVLDRVASFLWDLHNETITDLGGRDSLRHVSGEVFAMRRGVVETLPDGVVNEDSVIASLARRAGLRIVVAEAAVVDMMGVRTAGDFLRQRRRVNYGHLQTARLVAATPTTFETGLFTAPRAHLRILRHVLRRRREYPLAFLVASCLEGLAWAGAIWDRLIGRTHTTWRVAGSTKDLDRNT